jgi:hypothetical protein
VDEKRLRELAGLETFSEAAGAKAIFRLILVVDASPNSVLEDIMLEISAVGLVNLFRGARNIIRENPTFYLLKDKKAARKDAEERIEKAS